MKKTRRKNVFRGIRSSLNRFLSILFIVALGSGFLAGLFATSPDMYETADCYMDEYGLYDIDLKSTLGLTGEDKDAVSALSSVEKLQAAKVSDMVLADGNVTYTARVFGFYDADGKTALNRLHITEGRAPKAAGECVLQNVTGNYLTGTPEIGDVITVSRENVDYDTLCSQLVTENLTVVGIGTGPMCIGIEGEPTNVGSGSVSLDVYVTEDFFTYDYYTDFYITVAGASEKDTFSDAYDALILSAQNELEEISSARAQLRTDAVKGSAQEEIDALREMISSMKKTADTVAAMMKDSGVRLAQTAAVAGLLRDPDMASLLGKTQEAVLAQLKNSEAAGDDTTALWEKKLSDANEALEAIPDASWVVRTRNDSAGFSGYGSNVGKVAALSKIFPVFFFLVALLVALTTMTHLVEENRTQIGTLKALGFSDGQVLSEYMLYSLSASVLGCILGFSVGFQLFPKAISGAYGMMYFLPDTLTPVRIDIMLTVAPVTVVSILLATFWACYGEFRAYPAVLMVPKAPAAGKRIFLERIPFLWNRISFTHKVTCRNLFRYKKRFFMTVVGVAGCSALLVTGFGLRDSIHDIVDKQFDEIYRYQLTIVTSDKDAVQNDAALSGFLGNADQVTAWMPFASETGKAKGGSTSAGNTSAQNTSAKVNLTVPESLDRFGDFITLRERKSGKAVTLGTSGAVLTEKLAETLGVSEGDTVTLENADGIRGEVTVTGIAENYIASYAYLSQDTYRAAFGTEPEMNEILCCLTESADTEDITTDVLVSESVVYARTSRSVQSAFSDNVKSIDAIVLILILAAGLLCMVVLYNLTNVNICERRKELATIRVLGFHEKETENYIFRETNILSFLGSFAGLFVGIWLHSFVVRTVEIDQVMFGRNIYPLSFVYAMAISVVFTLAVNQIMKRQIRKVDMVEAMKAND